MEKGLADVRQDLEISKQRFWTQREDSTQEGGGSCEGTGGANIRGGQVSPVPWHGGQWGNSPLLCTSSLVSKIYTKQLPREKKKTNPKQQNLFPFLPNSKVSLFTVEHLPHSHSLPLKHMTLPCPLQHLMVEIQNVEFLVEPLTWGATQGIYHELLNMDCKGE